MYREKQKGIEYSRFGALLLIEPEIRPFCGPLYFSRSLTSPVGNVTANGSFGLVDTGRKKLMVTCCHVWEEFLTAKEQCPEFEMFLCFLQPHPVILKSKEPLDFDRRLDLATFDVEDLIPVLGDSRFYAFRPEAAPKPSIDDRFLFIGYPGIFRLERQSEIQFGRVPYATMISSVDDARFHADISQARYDEPELKNQPRPHGGISGSPCFRVRPDRPAQLFGFATGHIGGKSLDHLCFTSARCLNPDGSINRLP
jgi:hypothetical protein